MSTVLRALIAISVVSAAAVSAAAQADEDVRFEVVSIKPAAPGSDAVNRAFPRTPGRWMIKGSDALNLVGIAYPGEVRVIEGGPDWAKEARFDIVAAGDGITNQRLPAMIRAMLADRFKLTVHNEPREVDVYALVATDKAATRGLKPVDVDCSNYTLDMSSVQLNEPKICALVRTNTPTGREARLDPGRSLALGTKGLALSMLARNLRGYVDRPVVDRTGLTGTYAFALEFASPRNPDAQGPLLFTALQQQLGLKLEATRITVPAVIIDRLERPTED